MIRNLLIRLGVQKLVVIASLLIIGLGTGLVLVIPQLQRSNSGSVYQSTQGVALTPQVTESPREEPRASAKKPLAQISKRVRSLINTEPDPQPAEPTESPKTAHINPQESEHGSPAPPSAGSKSETPTQPQSGALTCTSNKSPTFTNHITNMTKVTKVSPPPMLLGSGLKTHSYLSVTGKVPVYAPAAATLESGAYYLEGNPGGEYILTFDVSCEVRFRFDHVVSPVQKIRDALNQSPQSDTRSNKPTQTVSVAAGEQIGETTGTVNLVWDFGVYNSATTNKYAGDPTYNSSDIYTTAVCPFDYFSAAMRTAYSSKFGPINDQTPVTTEFCAP